VAFTRDSEVAESEDAASAVAAIPSQVTRVDSADDAGVPAASADQLSHFDRRLVKESFARLASDPQQIMEYLYGRLFAANPELRGLFPMGMTRTRALAFRMFARLFWSLEDAAATDEALRNVAVMHRKYGVRTRHYEPFFEALLGTAEHVMGAAWNSELSAAWRATATYFGQVMTAAVDEDAREQPAWWTCEVVQHDRRSDSIAVLSVRPDRALTYQPGQYIAVQVPRWPRVWRNYSIANAPRQNGLIDLHVRAIPGGLVSTALVAHCATGDTLLLGAARGEMRVADSGRDLVCVAGGTGLSPVKAITEAIVGASGFGRRRQVTMYVGVRDSADLYDMRDLETLRLAYPSLSLNLVIEDDPGLAGAEAGRLPEAVARHPSFRDCDVYIAGPAGMITATVRALSSRVPAERLHHDPLEELRLTGGPPALGPDS
jgi:NAD(P)H-flavin reductase/hemoglobin-like flavoprotein